MIVESVQCSESASVHRVFEEDRQHERPPAMVTPLVAPGPRDITSQTRTLAASGAVGTADVFHGRLLFLDGEVRLVKNLTDLNHVAFVGGAPLRPFHKLFF